MKLSDKYRNFIAEHQLVFKNLTWLLSGSVLTAGIGFITTTIVARKLGPEAFGSIQYIFAIFAIIQTFENIIHPLVLKKALIEDQANESDIMSSSLAVMFFYFLLITLGSGFAYFWFGTLAALGVFLLSLGSVFRISNPIAFFFDANSLSKYTSSNLVVSKIVSSAYRICMVLVAPGVISQVAGQVVDSCVAFWMHVRVFKKLRPSFRLHVRMSFLKVILAKSIPWAVLGFLMMALLRVDQIILARLVNSAELGLYSAAVKLSEPWLILCTALMSSFYPKIVADRMKSAASYYGTFKRLFFMLFSVGIGIAILITLLGDFLVPSLFGAKYVQAIPVLKIHVWSNIFLFWIYCVGIWEVQEGKIRVQAFRLATGVLINIVSNYLLVPSMGAQGAAIATVLSYLWAGFLVNLFFPSTRPLFVTQLTAPFYILKLLK